jgi:UDP-N-acetylmuramyl pentapeptide phosphotransferase/UDP-N-acetylglucosamine-1-phosphate transferase
MPIFAQNILIILITYGITLALTAKVKQVLTKRAVLDIPNARSSHTQSTPRGGGWAFVIVLIPTLIITAIFYRTIPMVAGLIGGVVLLAFISWRDDQRGVSAIKRLSLHILAACLGSMAFGADQMIFSGALPFWLDRMIMIVGWAWFMNLYNFMDGIDGITCTETISLATGASLVMTVAMVDAPFAQTLTLILTGCALGFLAFNWHPAKIFMGDIGSVPLGYLCGFLLITLALSGHVIPAMILPLYYLADSGITITKRALRGEKIWQPHRQHFYQRAALQQGRHDTVVIWIAAANIALIGAALLAIAMPWLGAVLAIIVVAILLWRMDTAH